MHMYGETGSFRALTDCALDSYKPWFGDMHASRSEPGLCTLVSTGKPSRSYEEFVTVISTFLTAFCSEASKVFDVMSGRVCAY